jgi:cell division protein FtsB
MSLGKEKRTWSSLAYSRVTLAIMLVLIVLLAFSVKERYRIEREMAQRRAETEEELTDLKARKAGLTDQVEYLKNDAGVEAEIREHFDVAKEGERVVIIVDRTDETDPVASTTMDEDDHESFWSRLIPW